MAEGNFNAQVSVECERFDGVFHSDHSLRERELVGDLRSLVAPHYLDPIAIRIQREGELQKWKVAIKLTSRED